MTADTGTPGCGRGDRFRSARRRGRRRDAHVAEVLDVPHTTVRGWWRRFRARAPMIAAALSAIAVSFGAAAPELSAEPARAVIEALGGASTTPAPARRWPSSPGTETTPSTLANAGPTGPAFVVHVSVITRDHGRTVDTDSCRTVCSQLSRQHREGRLRPSGYECGNDAARHAGPGCGGPGRVASISWCKSRRA